MTHEEQRIWLIQQLLSEAPAYSRCSIPDNAKEQKNLLRVLMNVRPPEPISEEFLAVQDEYLADENQQAGITSLADLTFCRLSASFHISAVFYVND